MTRPNVVILHTSQKSDPKLVCQTSQSVSFYSERTVRDTRGAIWPKDADLDANGL